MKKYLSLIVVLLIASFALTACGGGSSKYSTSLDVDLVEFVFEPTTFTIPAGQEITITLHNNGAIEHELVIMKFGQAVSEPFDDNDEDNIYWEAEVEPGESGTFTFTAPSDVGTYQVVCGISGHLEAGMVAELFVVEP